MRNNCFIRSVLLVALLVVTPLHADTTADETAVAPPRDPSAQVEYRREKLSEEGLKSDKQISGEQAVSFPVDF